MGVKAMGAPLLPDGSNQLLGEAGQILDYVRGLVAGKYARAEADRYHGFAHAQEVDEHVQAMCAAGDIQVTRLEELALRIAALMHDVGYTEYSSSWSQDRREHIRASLDFAMDVLRDAPGPTAQGTFAMVVGYLIAHHDDTNYKHPSMAWGGGIQSVPLGRHADRLEDFEGHLTAEQRRRLGVLVGAIREADGLMGTGQAGAVRTFEYSVARGLPVFAPGCPLSAWCWEESAVGNVRLAAKRALIDAATLEGRRRARRQYEETERFVAGMCEQSQIPYYRETFLATGADRSEADAILSPTGFQLERYEGWQSPDAALRAISLFAARGAHVDAGALVEVRPYAVSALTPRVAAVSRTAVERCCGLHACLVRDYALSLFDLTGIVAYWADGSSHRMAPVVVVTGCDPATGSATTTIVDGHHRAWLARQLGVDAIWTVSIAVAGGQPLAARAALSWEDVREIDSEPRNRREPG